MTGPMDAFTWPTERLGEALEALATWADFGPRDVEAPPFLVDLADRDAVDAWMESAGAWLGVEVEAVEAAWPAVGELLSSAAPAVVKLPATAVSPARWLLLVGRDDRPWGRPGVRALGPDLAVRRVPLEPLRAALCHVVEEPLRAPVRSLLARAGVPASRHAVAEREILRERLGAARIDGCWLFRLDPGASLARQFRHAGVFRRLGRMLVVQTALYALGGVGWYILGRGALQGTLDRPWLVGWGLAVVTMIPLQLLSSWHGGFLALEAGTVFKQRLLAGAIRMDPGVVRHEGAGSLLGRVIESSAVEAGALSGAVASAAALPEVLIAVAVLATGAGGPLHALVYALWVVLGVAVALRYAAARRAWTVARVALTNDLVERMVGHRTRLAQEAPERRHDGEDKALERYVAASESLDRAQVLLAVLVPRGWTLVGVAALVPAMLDATTSVTSLAVGVGAVVLAGHALRSISAGLVGLLGAGIAWREVAPLFHAAARRDLAGAPLFALGARGPRAGAGRVLLEATDVVFRHEGRAEPVLKGVTLRIAEGDRILLEGPSGGGKSTLGAVLAGLRAPTSGLLLLGGLDARSVGAGPWRRRVVTAPQFHENHVMTGTVAFNLLMGRRWPAGQADLDEAEAVCRELELGPLLERMPSGLQQMVGESGWRLSHGEQSRLFMARALLQGAEVVVLDESFAALDPETLRRSLECALRRCPSLLVIAHP